MGVNSSTLVFQEGVSVIKSCVVYIASGTEWERAFVLLYYLICIIMIIAYINALWSPNTINNEISCYYYVALVDHKPLLFIEFKIV